MMFQQEICLLFHHPDIARTFLDTKRMVSDPAERGKNSCRTIKMLNWRLGNSNGFHLMIDDCILYI